MNISYNWLKEYVNFDLTPDEVAEALTSIGLETGGVEEVQTIKGGLEGIVIGEVLTCEPHPNSDHMHVTTVNLGQGEPVQIVCGAANVAAGQKVVVATLGTKLYDGEECFTIKKSKLRAGEGDKSFVAGADIGSMSTMTKAEGEAFGKLGNDVFLMIEHFPIPVIAAVNGFALGGGNELAMSCDIRICSDNAVFGQPEVGLGITPGFGGTQRLARLVGMGMAKQLVYSALNIKADEAYRIGLVNAVYPQAELMENVLKLANKIAKNAPIAVRNCKKAINDGISLPIEKAVEVEEKLFGDCFETHDQKEGMACFLSREKPKPKAVFTNN